MIEPIENNGTGEEYTGTEGLKEREGVISTLQGVQKLDACQARERGTRTLGIKIWGVPEEVWQVLRM